MTLVGIVATPVLVGVTAGARWPDADDTFYSALSQAIAALFIAITVDFYAHQASRRDLFGALRLVLLIAQSWFGFFACIRALANDGTAVTAGLACTGVTAAAVLVSLTLYERIQEISDNSDKDRIIAAVVVTLFLLAAVSLLAL